MRKLICMGLILLVILTLCACTDTDVQGGANEPVFGQQTTTTTAPTTQEQTTQESTTTTTAEAPTEPAHSELYIPGYSTEQVIEYFEEIVLHMEYTEGDGDVSLVQKWNIPMVYRIYGSPTEEDLAVLTALFARLNEIEGFPGIRAAADDEYENMTISFLDQEGFDAEFSDFLNGEYAFGATQFWYYTDTNDIYTARVGYRTDIDQTTRTSILLEEIVNMLGTTDTVVREDSIVYQYSNDNLALSDIDWLILKLLYHPEIQCGMNADSCRAVIERLYY